MFNLIKKLLVGGALCLVILQLSSCGRYSINNKNTMQQKSQEVDVKTLEKLPHESLSRSPPEN